MSEAGLFKEAVAELHSGSSGVPVRPPPSSYVWPRPTSNFAICPAPEERWKPRSRAVLETGPIYALLSTVYEKSGHIGRAIPAMRLAIEREPQSEQRRFEYGMLLTNAMAPAAAVIQLEESLQIFPNLREL